MFLYNYINIRKRGGEYIDKVDIKNDLEKLSPAQKDVISLYASKLKQQFVEIQRDKKDMIAFLGLGRIRDNFLKLLKEYFGIDFDFSLKLSKETCDEWIKLLNIFKFKKGNE